MDNQVCPWYSGFASINFTNPAGTAFEKSLFNQYAEWGVDFIKYDCVYGGSFELSQIEAAAEVIKPRSSQPMVLSLSPGDYKSPSEHANTISSISNMYRITNDDWDNWIDIRRHFIVAAEHAAASKIEAAGLNGKSWPDLDMLPFGYITEVNTAVGPSKWTSLTKPQQRTQMALWCIARSPLMFGGAATMLHDQHDAGFTLSLLTNEFLLSVNSHSKFNRQVSSSISPSSGVISSSIWAAESTSVEGTYYAAFFNTGEDSEITLSVSIFDITLGRCSELTHTMDAWDNSTLFFNNGTVSVTIDLYDAVFLQLSNCQ